MTTIVKISKHKDRWRLKLACGHSILWSGEKPKLGDEIDCPEEPIGIELHGKTEYR